MLVTKSVGDDYKKLETKSVLAPAGSGAWIPGEDYKMLVTVLAILVTNIHYSFFISIGHQDSKRVANIVILSLTSQNRYTTSYTRKGMGYVKFIFHRCEF